jgi:hypothetical protein
VGYAIASITSIQGTLYLLVLSVNSVVAIRRGFVGAPGELPIRGGLAILLTTSAFILMANVFREQLPS